MNKNTHAESKDQTGAVPPPDRRDAEPKAAPAGSPRQGGAPSFNKAVAAIAVSPPSVLDSAEHYKTNCAHSSHSRRLNLDGTTELRHAPCLRWTCTLCGPRLQDQLRQQLQNLVPAHGLTHMVTLTSRRRPGESMKELSRRLMRALHNLLSDLSRTHGGSFAYIWFKEVGGRSPHLHVLVSVPVTVSSIRREWRRLSGAYQVDVTPVTDVVGVVDYVTKAIPLNARRFGRTVGRWYGKSKSISLVLRARRSSPEPSEWRHYRGPIRTGGFPPEQLMVLRRHDDNSFAHVVACPGLAHPPAGDPVPPLRSSSAGSEAGGASDGPASGGRCGAGEADQREAIPALPAGHVRQGRRHYDGVGGAQ